MAGSRTPGILMPRRAVDPTPMVSLDIVSGILLIVVLFAGSTYLVTIPIRQEVKRAVLRSEPLPRVVGWWRGVVERGWWLTAGGALVMVSGAWAWWLGATEPGGWLLLIGAGIVAYVLQGVFVLRVVHRAVARAQREKLD